MSFALPPSLGTGHAKELAKEFAMVLYEAGFETILPCATYQQLASALIEGEVDVAWTPPLICAEVEEMGGKALLQAVRQMSTTYRSALVCRATDSIDLENLKSLGSRQVRVAWVDKRSMGGYLLPRRHLAQMGIDAGSIFEKEIYAGSYSACLNLLLDCEVDVTASFANARGLGYAELLPDEAHHIRTFAYTPECPNDALVWSPKSVHEPAAIKVGIEELMKHPSHRKTLAKALEVDALIAPTQSYLDQLAWALAPSK